MMSRITGANTGKWVRLFNDLARTTTTPEASTGQWLIFVTLEADQAVQEARFAGACHNQHAGRPAPSLRWPGERKSIVQPKQVIKGTAAWTPRRPGGPWLPGPWAGAEPWPQALPAGIGQGAGPGLLGLSTNFVVLKNFLGGREGVRRLKRCRARDTPPTPPFPRVSRL